MGVQVIQSGVVGQNRFSFAGGNTESAVVTGGGLLVNLVTVTAGTAVMSIYDGTNSTTGVLIYTSPTTDTTGSVKTVNLPFTTGVVVKGTTNTQGLVGTYNGLGAYGNT